MKKKPTIEEWQDIAIELADVLKESHQWEMDNGHGGDVKRAGPAPKSCSYCRTIKEFSDLNARRFE